MTQHPGDLDGYHDTERALSPQGAGGVPSPAEADAR